MAQMLQLAEPELEVMLSPKRSRFTKTWFGRSTVFPPMLIQLWVWVVPRTRKTVSYRVERVRDKS